MFDDAEQAAAAWRESLGEAAIGVVPTPVNTSERLLCLAYLDQGDEHLIGFESRAALDNYLHVRRRIGELQKVLRKKRMPLPETPSLFDDVKIEPEAGPAKELLPEWVRWNAEQSGLPEQLAERAVAAATDLDDTEPSSADG